MRYHNVVILSVGMRDGAEVGQLLQGESKSRFGYKDPYELRKTYHKVKINQKER